jgi:hypothetical protein
MVVLVTQTPLTIVLPGPQPAAIGVIMLSGWGIGAGSYLVPMLRLPTRSQQSRNQPEHFVPPLTDQSLRPATAIGMVGSRDLNSAPIDTSGAGRSQS